MDAKLYIGFPLTNEKLKSTIEALDDNLRGYFIDNGEDYLQTLESGTATYLGKPVPPLTSLEILENMQENIYSLLQKLIPDFPFKETPLIIFTKMVDV